MKINVPSPEESEARKRRKKSDFLAGLILGIVLLGLGISKFLWWGFENVEMYTWIALGFGILSFGFIVMWLGRDFWKDLF